MKRRVLSLVLTLALCLNLCPVWVLAAEGEAGLCPHHPEHTEECGYAVEEPGAPCTFVCRVCPIEERMEALPASVSEENCGQVQTQLEEIYALYEALTDAEQQQVDLSPCAALLEQMEGLESEGYSETTASDGTFKLTLEADRTYDTPYEVKGYTIVDTQSFTLTGKGESVLQVNGTGVLELRGKIDGDYYSNDGRNEVGVKVLAGGSLTVQDAETEVKGGRYGLWFASGAAAQLSAGTYFGNNAAIHAEDGDYAALLEKGYAFFGKSDNPILPADAGTVEQLTVKQCTSHVDRTCSHNEGSPTHTWTCPACGLEERENCTFTFKDDGTGTCESCKSTIEIKVNEGDLADLVYDGTLQPEEVGVTVTLTDGSNKELVKDTDYSVVIVPITNAGQATVTVTGKTFHGTFVKTYTVKQDEPGIKWDDSTRTVNYDGSAVTVDELPHITITIRSTEEDLHPYLRYAYKKTGDADFTDGLPADAGTYQVKAYLEESQNYKAAETDPLLTLTIDPINPIVTAPAAKTLTYNRTAQELVTGGTLNPVAVRDGLGIQFSESQNGPWSADIPAKINAGEYHVWYQVTGLTGNYIAPNPNPAEVANVKIQRKHITPFVTLSEYTYLYDGGYKQPKVTVKDDDNVTVILDTEYEIKYADNQNVGTAKAIVTDKDSNGGNYDLEEVKVEFQITQRTQETLSITQKPNTITYGDKFTLGTTGGSGSGAVTWEITDGADVAEVDANSGQVTVTGHGRATVKATKSGAAPTRTPGGNYEDATDSWTFTAVQKPVTATVTAEDKTYDGDSDATVHATVEQGILAGDVITITGLTGTFSDTNAGAGKTVTVVTSSAAITGHNSEHYAVSYSSTTVTATIHKAVANITTVPVAANPTYNGAEQELIGTGAVVDTTGVTVEYALSEDGPYSTEFPKAKNAGTYTVWYRIQETDNYTGEAPTSVTATINKKPVTPTITLDESSFTYDGTPKEPVVTLTEADGTIPASEYMVSYSDNINVGTATVTVTAKADGNYSFTPDPVTASFAINKEQAKVITAPEVAGDPLTFSNRAQKLVTAGVGSGGTMVYRVGDTGTYSADIPTGFNAKDYTVYYKVQGDSNHSDSVEGSVTVTIAPKTVKDPTIELQDKNGNPLVSYTYDGNAKTPTVVVKDGSTVIAATEYNVIYGDNIDAGRGTVNITDKPNGNYTVTGSATFVINKADIVFNPAPSAAKITYNGKAHELLKPGTTSGGEVLYALNSSTSTYTAAIPTAIEAGNYTVYYKVTGDKNHNDLTTQKVDVTIQRKPLTDITIELTPDSFEYDGTEKMPKVAVKFTEGRTETVVPETEYDWRCDKASPKDQGTYTITITDAAGGNYDLSVATTKTATFTIGKTTQEELVIEGKPAATYYGDTFQLTTRGGSGNGTVSWSATGPATVDAGGNVTINGVGEVTITAEKAADTNYESAQAQWTFTATPKPVTASVVVDDKAYDGTTNATVNSADITADLLTGDKVTIDPASITAAFDTPGAGTGKNVTLDVSKVQVTGDDAAKYAISYPDTVTADITQATTQITTDPAAIAPLTYNGQPQALVTAGKTNVGFLVYSLDGTSFSPEIPTGTNAGTYNVYYKVDGTADYTGVAVNTTPIPVTIAPKPITPKVELSESSYLYDGTKKEPKITVKDGNTVLDEGQYTVSWDNDLTSAGTHTATIKNAANGNYTFTITAKVEITEATQDALKITGKPTHVYYGDTIKTLDTAGGSGNGTVTWSITAGGATSTIDSTSGELTVTDTGSITVKAERAVPNYGTVSDTWTFTVEPKPVVAEVTVTAKVYDGNTSANVTATVKDSDLVDSDTVAISGLTGTYDNANAGTGKTVTLNSSGATVTGTDAAKYSVSYPDTVKADINPKNVTVTVTLSDHDLKTESDGSYFYEFDGTEKTPTVTATADGGAVLADSDYSVSYANNKNVGDATVTVTAKASGNYTFTAAMVQFAIKEASAVLDSTPQAKDLTYTGQDQDLVTGGTATGGTVLYSKDNKDDPYSATIPQETAAGIYTIYYMVKGDDNHADIAPSSVSVTIKPKEFTPVIKLSQNSYVYSGSEQKPTVTVKDGTVEIDSGEYTVSYRDNINAGTATVIVSDNNGGNYIVNGTATFEITKADPTVTAPTGSTNLQYSGAPQELVKAGVTNDGTVVYAVNGGNYTSAIPTASAVGTYTISWKVQGDSNHNDTTPAELTVTIAKNTVTNPTITLSSDTFKYNGSQQKPTITVYDDSSRVIPEHEYTVTITGVKSNNMVDVDTYTVTIAAAANSNYEFQGNVTRTFEIVPADQETISITGTQAQVSYGDTIQLGTTGGSGGTISWTVAAKDGGSITNLASTISNTGLLTVKDVGGPITVTVTCSKGGNYSNVTASWEFTAGQKSVTAVLAGADRNYIANDQTATVTATVPDSELVSGDSIAISGLTATFDDPNVGTDKKVTVNSTNAQVSGTNSEKYDITYPAFTTASILPVPATMGTEPTANTLTYDASQAQALVTAGTATGGIMVYSLDGTNFTPNIPKAKDSGTYTVYYKVQGDGNHTDSDSKTVSVTITQQTVTPQIELTPPSAQYDGNVKRPEVTVRDTANNVIPTSEYKVTYVTDGGKNWTDQGTYTVKVEDITGGNYVISTATENFTISTTPQNPLEIVNKPGLVYYGDTFTLSAVGGSGSGTVTWSVDNASIVEIDANGFVKIVGVGSATITATKPGGTNYGDATATYPLNALKKPITAIVTADDRVYQSGDTSATIHVTWEKGALVGNDSIDTTSLSGTFADDSVGTNKTVNITGDPVDDATAQKYDITIPASTTASILKADATAPTLTANNRDYDGTAKPLVSGGNAGTTLYSDAREGVYSTTVPTGTNAGTYTVWYKEQGDSNHNDSQPQSVQVTISRKTLTADTMKIELSGNDLQTDANGAYYYNYDGTEKTPTVTITDGSAVVPASEYKVSYSDNKNVSTADKKATVTITDSGDGNYVVSGSITFEIRQSGAQLVSSPQAKDLTYTGQPQELVTVGTATGGHIEYAVDGVDCGQTIPKETEAGTYTVTYKVVGDDNHEDNPTIGSVSVTIKPKEVISPKITVTGSYTYDGNPIIPAGSAVTVEDGDKTIPTDEYTLSYRDNVNAGTATVIVTNANGGNYIVNGTATFEIGKAAAAVGTAPTGKTGLSYNGTAQELVTGGTATGGTMVYSLEQNGEYSPAIPTGKEIKGYTVWYKVQGDSNHNDSTPVSVSVSIIVNTVTNPTIQVNPESVTYNGEKQEPTVTIKDDNGLVIDGSEYTVSYTDTSNNNSDLIQVGTYTLTVTEVSGKNYTFDATAGKNTATFTILPADQTPLTITGTRERVYYGDNIQLGTTGGNGAVTWSVGSSTIASITNGLLNITGVGSVTVTATSKATGYDDQSATWSFYAEKKPVTAVVTAEAKTYDGNATATVTATLQPSDFVGTDSFTITLNGCTFEDPNVGTDKKVNVVSTSPAFTVSTNPGSADNHENYAITYPATATASILKAEVTGVTAPEAVTGLEYTGLPQALVTAGTVTEGGTMEYSVDNITYSASLPTGINAGDYDVWYRVKGDSNHNDTESKKLGTVTIDKQTVTNPTIEFTPSGASYDGQEHKPAVTVKDKNNRVIPDSEYTLDFGATDWIKAGDHTVTITGKTDGNYDITTKTGTFNISQMGQNPLSIVGQPGKVQYGDSFTLSTVGGSGTGTVTWNSSDPTVATIDKNGLVEVLKAGPATITATKQADSNHGALTVTWSFSAEKKPVTPIVTAKDKEYDGKDTAQLVIAWKDGDLLNGDSITLNLTGAFGDANVGTNKTVNITGTAPDSNKYDITIPRTTTASITPKAASVSGSTATELEYNGSEQFLVGNSVTATNGTMAYSRDGSYYTLTVPKETNAGTYTVYYKAQASGNYKDSPAVRVDVTINPKPVTSPAIELSPNTFDYDGTAKRPDVVVKDGSTVIPASEYTVSYSNNTAVGTATVTISDNAGGNYTVSGTAKFTIQAGSPVLTAEPQPRELTYTGAAQALVTAGTAVNGRVVYSLDQNGSYSTSIPRKTNAGNYEVWYKVQGENGASDTQPQYVPVTIQPKEVTPTILLNGQYAFSTPYTGSAITPTVTVNVGGEATSSFTPTYSNNTKVGTATVTVQSTGGNYKFFGVATFEITKGKAKFSVEPKAKNLEYAGEAQELVEIGVSAQSNLLVVYSTDGSSYLPIIPTATNRGNYLVIAKVQGNEMYEDSDPVILRPKIDRNQVQNPTVTLSDNSMNYTGSELKPAVTVIDKGVIIPASEYTVSYSNNVNVGEATVTVTGNTNNYTYFTGTAKFQIVDASQPVLAITGKPDRVYYGDTVTTLRTEGASGTVTWSVTGGTNTTIDQGIGRLVVKDAGVITVTATSGSLSDTWTFTVEPKPVTAVVTAADKVYDNNNTATLTVTVSSGLVSGDVITTGSVTAQGHFSDVNVGSNKTVVIESVTVPDDIRAKYDISYPAAVMASITPKPAVVLDTDKPALAGPLTYNGGAQALLTKGGTADGGNLAYSVDGGTSYSFDIPKATDAGSYTVWYKVIASNSNYKDSAPVKLGDVTISANTDTPTVLCTPSTFQYDGTEKTPTVVVRDSAQRIIPESEYTVSLPSRRIAVGSYTITVTDKAGGNYAFTNPVTGTFEIVAASQNPLSIITDKPTDLYYGDTFRLSAMGGSGSGAIHWSVDGSVATIDSDGVVTVKGTGGFTVKAYREASSGYSQSNTDSVPFEAKPKPVTPVVTAKDKPYDGKPDATLTASWKPGDLVGSDTITLTVEGHFETAEVGTGKQVTITKKEPDGASGNYSITWPASTTATISKVDAKLAAAPAGKDLTYTGNAQELVTGGSTVGGIGTIEYSLSQSGQYSTTIPTGTNAGKYTVWYRVADSVNYTGIPAAAIEVEIAQATPTISTAPTATGTEGQLLSEITFSNGGAASVGGKFAWKDGSVKPGVGTSQQDVVFTPNDTANYTTVEFQIEVTIQAASNSGSDSGSGGSSTETSGPSTTVQDGTASTVLSASDGSSLVREAVANQSDRVVIKPEVSGDVTRTEVSIPASTVSRLQSETNAALTVSAPIADVTIPNQALDTLSSAGGTVNVATEQVDQAVVLTLTAGGEKVEELPGGLTLSVPVEDAGPGTVAVLVHEDGTRETIRKSVVEDGMVNIPLNGSATVEIVDNSKEFTDVSSESWAADAVAFASAHELFSGTSETTFSPDQTMSRGMLTTVLYNLEGRPEQDLIMQDLTDGYSDVSSDAWYAEGVAWAVENGIASGYGNGEFGPNDSVTREQLAVMLWKYAGGPQASDQTLRFTDAEQASGYAQEALCWAAEKGILSGYSDGRLAPGKTATRAEAAQMLKNFMEST